jgi:hypothetical protein
MKVGDWIRPRDRTRWDEVYRVDNIELDTNELYLQKGGNKLLATLPLVTLTAPEGAAYPSGFTQSPADFEITAEPGGKV